MHTYTHRDPTSLAQIPDRSVFCKRTFCATIATLPSQPFENATPTLATGSVLAAVADGEPSSPRPRWPTLSGPNSPSYKLETSWSAIKSAANVSQTAAWRRKVGELKQVRLAIGIPQGGLTSTTLIDAIITVSLL